ncbi:hypothetical protein G3I60_43225 [Streptomyces sp. SID13666]|uniref:hypothetical protein n=1 Tax=unclassified Streptomyces TaxID=2593676 RepID=UPI0013BF9701|nr:MULTISPECIES: hypothetical protein [unclassified Streptomyces]NEA60795.1 hypothetical protein [Streptomyces sp. SID13666]NEA77256.1 hypothetical protein [Streptomyces sp. SID13588]
MTTRYLPSQCEQGIANLAFLSWMRGWTPGHLLLSSVDFPTQTSAISWCSPIFWPADWEDEFHEGNRMSTPPRRSRRRSAPAILGVPPRPPIDLSDETIPQAFYTAGDFSAIAPVHERTAMELRRDNASRSIGLAVSLVAALAMGVAFFISFGWVVAVAPAAIVIASTVLLVMLNRPRRPPLTPPPTAR